MNITGIGSGSWYTGMGSATARSARSIAQDGGGDSAAFSAQALAALGRTGGGPPPPTDEMAAEFGATLQEEDPDLFSQIDGDGDGTLTATEMEAGKDQIRAAMDAKGMGPPPPPPPEQGQSDGLDDEQVQQLLQSLREQGWSDVQLNQVSDVLAQVMSAS